MAESEAKSRQGRQTTHSLIFILITVFADTIGFGIIIPVLPDLLTELTGEGLGAVARYGGWLMFVFALMQFVCAPIMGNLSDRFGRRPVLLVSLLALGGDYLLMGLAPTLSWLFAGRILAGVFGATHSTANAYAADVTAPEKRAQAFGLLGAVWGVGFTLGPMIGGLLGGFGSRVPFYFAAGLAVANGLYGMFVLPETLPAEKRRPFSFKRANPVGAVAMLGKRPGFLALLIAIMFYALAHDSLPATWSYYTIEKFGWTARGIGWSLGGVGVATMIVQGGLIGPIVSWLGEKRAALVGFVVMAFGYLAFGMATEGWMMYAFMLPFCLGSVAMPALRSLMSDRVDESEQGELSGAISSIMSVMAIPAPLVMTQLFSTFTAETAPIYLPGVAFIAASGLSVICALVAAVGVSRLVKRKIPAVEA